MENMLMKFARGFFRKKRRVVYLAAFILLIVLNTIAWYSTRFCDAYIKYIFPVLTSLYGRITSLLSFSLGEILLAAAVILTVIGAVLFAVSRFHKMARVKKVAGIYGSCYAWTALIAGFVMTLNCFVLYHASSFEAKYQPSAMAFLTITDETELVSTNKLAAGEATAKAFATSIKNENSKHEVNGQYSYEDLAILRDYIVEKCNMLAEQVARDEDGNAVYDGDMITTAQNSMQKMGSVYEQLSGYYVTPKYFANSDFFSQQYIQGYYFPFSMEANVNSVMYITNVPAAMCHELAHTKGFIYEDDANMIGYLACINSDDTFFQYCGYLSILNYVNNDFYTSIHKSKSVYKKHVRISELVCNDNVFLTEDAWKEVEKKAVIKTEVVDKVSDKITNTTLKLNGVKQGMMQYNEVVDEMLRYYDGVLY